MDSRHYSVIKRILSFAACVSTVFLLCTGAQAASTISFTNGFWSTGFQSCTSDFDSLNGDPADACMDGLIIAWPKAKADCGGNQYYSEIVSSANNSGGAGGRGFKRYHDAKVGGGGSSELWVSFNSSDDVKKFWLRFFGRHTSGATKGGKFWYIHTNDKANLMLAAPQGPTSDQVQIYMYGGSAPKTNCSNCFLNSGGIGTSFDGQWHYYELYADIGTAGNNDAVVRWWIDGKLMHEETGFNWNMGSNAFSHVEIQQSLHGSSCGWTDELDDFAVALPFYANFITDSHGNKMIGPESVSQGSDGQDSGGEDNSGGDGNSGSDGNKGGEDSSGGGCFTQIVW